MGKKIVVLAGSPRIGGNTDLLCDEMIRGAEESGNEVTKFYLAQKKRKNNSPFEEYSEAAPEPSVSIEEKADLYDAIDLLPPTYKTVVILQYFQGMKINEIAQVMSIPVGSVKAYLFRAKESLRNQLEDGNREKVRAE